MAKGKKKAGAKQAQTNAEDDDWDALLEADSKVQPPVEPDAEKKEESTATAEVVSEKKEEGTTQTAAEAFLAAQGLSTGDGDGEKKDNKKKKKKKKGGAGEPKAEEKVRI
jgi:hypothetical protein